MDEHHQLRPLNQITYCDSGPVEESSCASSSCSVNARHSAPDDALTNEQKRGCIEETNLLTARPRYWRKSIGNAWHAAVSKLPVNVRTVLRLHTSRTNETETMLRGSTHCPPINGTHRGMNVPLCVKESFQSGVDFVVQPLRKVSASANETRSYFRARRGRDGACNESKAQSPNFTVLPTQRPFLTRYTSVMDVSAREVNKALSPIYRQSRWDVLVVCLSCCAEWLQSAGLAITGVLFPTLLVLSWWNYFADTRPVAFLRNWWLWWTNSLQTGRRRARDGTVPHTDRIVAAGVALAIYNSAMQQAPPPSRQSRRSKRRKRSLVSKGGYRAKE